MVPMRSRAFRAVGPVSEVGHGLWGMGGWTGSDDEESIAALERVDRARLHVLRYGARLRTGQERVSYSAACSRNHRDKPLIVATKIPPKNLKWPALAGVRADRGLPRRSHPAFDRNEPAQPRTVVGRPAAVSRLDRRVGGRRTLAARGGRSQARGPDSRLRHQRQSLAADECHSGVADQARGQRAGRLQPLRPESRGRAVPGVPRAGRRRHRARAVRRRQPDRHADARHAAGRKATGGTSTSRREQLAATLGRVDAVRRDLPPG